LSSFRLALQGQCKALLDASHSRNMQQLQGLLEAEQWVAVDVPAGFQVRGWMNSRYCTLTHCM
jgi:hypothetical protein